MKGWRIIRDLSFGALYLSAYTLVHVHYLSTVYRYFGFETLRRTPSFLVLSAVICLIPLLLFRGPRVFSSMIALFAYILLYVPIVVTFTLGSDKPLLELLGVELCFMLCMSILFAVDSFVIRMPFEFRLPFPLTSAVLACTLAAIGYLLFVYRGNLKLVSFADVYVQRSANADLGTGFIARYTSAWLYSVLAPLCLAIGLTRKRPLHFCAGVCACMTLYLATAAKSAVVLPVVYVMLYVLFARERLKYLLPLLLGSLSLLMLALAYVDDSESVLFTVAMLVLVRTIGGGGLLTKLYYDFFAFHPFTYYTHISLLNRSGAYPYGSLQVGQAVGQYYFSADMSANANFWATDGIASLGLIGVGISTCLCASLFIVVNSATRGYDRLFVLLCFLPFMVSLFNMSLASSIWSGGAFFLTLFFLLNPREGKGGPAQVPALAT